MISILHPLWQFFGKAPDRRLRVLAFVYWRVWITADPCIATIVFSMAAQTGEVQSDSWRKLR
jgi:hypothetical protein